MTRITKQNITIRTEKERALIEMCYGGDIFKSLIENMNEGVFASCEKGIIYFANSKMAKMTGYSKKELVGANGHELLLDSSNAEHVRQKTKRRKTGISEDYELCMLTKKGEKLWIRVSSSPIMNADGEFLGAMSIISDITDKKIAQLKQEVVFKVANLSNFQIADLQNIFAKIRDEISRIVDTTNMYISLLDQQSGMLTFPYVNDQFNDTVGFQDRFPANGLTEMIIEGKKAVLLRNMDSSDEPKKGYEVIGKKPICWLGVPLKEGNQCIGALVVLSYSDPEAYNEEDKKVLEYVSNQISGTITRITSLHKLMAKSEELKVEHKNTLLSQSKLLSTQLNPHFIFNSLNSIQYYILNKDEEPALEFLSKFSALMRAVLNNSEKSHIPIAEEIKFLRLYLDLEKGRHDGKFDYEIVVEKRLNQTETLIPPMLLQPFIENTIFHGVGHLKSGGQIKISFEKCQKAMCCTIRDNGVGRAMASELKNLQTGKKYKSKSTSIINNRIEILNEIDSPDYSSETKDLFDMDGNAIGTEVCIKFPLVS